MRALNKALKPFSLELMFMEGKEKLCRMDGKMCEMIIINCLHIFKEYDPLFKAIMLALKLKK